MANKYNLTVRIEPDIRNRIRSLADKALTNESIWVRQVISKALSSSNADNLPAYHAELARPRNRRTSLRLHPDDQLLLIERAAARGTHAATYVAVLVRAHLRNLAPLPTAELQGLARSVAELSALNRSLNQIASAMNCGQPVNPPGQQYVLEMLKICTALLGYTKDIIKLNTESWSVGRAKASD